MKSVVKLIPIPIRDRYRLQWHDFKLKLLIDSEKFKRQFFRPAFPNVQDGSINLHLGCGSVDHPDFINVDGLPAPHIHYVRAINDLSPFKTESVDLIYASHCLEHFSHLHVPQVLDEWFRVLKKKGVLRLSVPNFDLLLKIYQENSCDIDTILTPLMGGQDYQYNFHMIAFNKKKLETLLINAGFREVREWLPGSSEFTTFDDYSIGKVYVNHTDYSVSLNIEAVK
ncbi:methyltransferase domain-containing protein [Phormidesmis priestleyi ULC007]|uniref:Methyltransferase domain-containing protein n=1 Tax=Phormidesmis priestleyi ULC007 TaxID=1920490 RepID=A0A2T1DNE9_9CYAN|nr:methyltransferase domain-containing protein [Phormidesmis priestleyi]PSB22027.1 methyltransferase domain-containing protein [Phormidesmis priestleyi ULC007]PZO55005.1 MAG: methyltransferase domain-containing protein [Phormidesmis priestleyi]